MASYTLNIGLNTAGINFFINNNQTICIARPLVTVSKYMVICSSFTPFGNNNNVVFNDDSWFLLAFQQQIQKSMILNFGDTKSAKMNFNYQLENAGFGISEIAGQSGFIGFENLKNNATLISGGIGQKINANNQGEENVALDVTNCPLNQTTYFDIGKKLWVFAASGLSTNMVVPKSLLQPRMPLGAMAMAVGKYLEVDISKENTIHFNEATNLFEPGDLPG